METRKNYNNPLTATITGIRDLFRKQIPSGTIGNERLDGKRVLVDGASSGLGFAVAVELAKRGADLIMACRSGIPLKGEEVKKLSGSGKVKMIHIDFADSASVKKAVTEIKEFGKIDIYVCNAGIVPKKSRKTSDGFEEMFMVNYLSKYLFIRLLLENDLISSSGDSRIIIVSSESHRNPKQFEWEKFGVYEDFTIGKSVENYGYFKLLLTTFAAELSERINKNGHKISVFALCPGPVNSNIAREAPKIFHPLMKLVFSLFFRSPEKAMAPVVYFAVSDDVKGKDFDYFFLMTRKEIDEKAADKTNREKLWDLSEQALKNRRIL